MNKGLYKYYTVQYSTVRVEANHNQQQFAEQTYCTLLLWMEEAAKLLTF